MQLKERVPHSGEDTVLNATPEWCGALRAGSRLNSCRNNLDVGVQLMYEAHLETETLLDGETLQKSKF